MFTMVIGDISVKSVFKKQEENPPFHIDRLFAFIIDFLIISPLMGLFTAGIIGDFKLNSLGVEQLSFSFLMFQYIFICFVLFLLYESLFIYFLKATPGHYFLYLRLENTKTKKMNFVQILFRSAFKFLGFVFLGLPFLEVLFRDDRTMFYDRLSFTKVISLKKHVKSDELPHQVKHWVLSWVNSFVFVWFLVLAAMLYQMASRDVGASVKTSKSAACPLELNSYLLSYLQEQNEQKNKECIDKIVNHEFDKVLTSKEEIPAINYFAKFVLTDDAKMKSDYLKKFCSTEEKNILCAEKSTINIGSVEDKDLVYHVYALSKVLKEDNPLATFVMIDALYDKLEQTDRLDNYYMQAYLKMKETDNRGPASAAEDVKIDFNQFKKRVGVKK